MNELEKNSLQKVHTCDLVAELRRREGVEAQIAEPYCELVLHINGPAIVLTVID